MRQVYRRSLLAAVSMLTAPVLAMPARAQDAGASERGVEEIVVTAQRRQQSILSVPVSIQAITGDKIAESGIKDVTDLASTVPGFIVSDAGASWQLFIRGVGNQIFTSDPSVATYIDDVPRPYSTMIPQFIDVERVEVLKGAQGGLYGRNATGGVINIITRQPKTDELSASFRASYGEKNTLKVAGFVNVPLNDKVAFTLAGERRSHDPYVRNIAKPNSLTAAMFPNGSFLGTPQQTADFLNQGVLPRKGHGNENLWAGSAKILFKPTDNFTITIAADYGHTRDTNGTQEFTPTEAYTAAAIPAFFGNFGIVTNFPAGFFKQTDGKWTTSKATQSIIEVEDYGVSATAVLNLPGVDLTSISAYRVQDSHFFDQFPSAPVPTIQSDNFRDRHFFYQELRAQSTGDGPFHFIGGGTYMRNVFGLTGVVHLLRPLVALPMSINKTVVTNWSVYLQGTYDITESLNLTVSGRYIHEKNVSDFTAPIIDHVDSTDSKFIPSVTLSYKLPEGGNVYARWARGYKGGGVNPSVPPSLFPVPSLGAVFGPETVDTFEAGYRAALFDHRVQLTTAIFYNNYKDLQLVGTNTLAHPELSFAIVNGGTARTWGGEASVTWRAIDSLTLGINAGYLNAKYKKVGIPPNEFIAPFNLSGRTMSNSPKLQLAMTADLDQPVNDDFRVVGNLLVSHVSRIIWGQSALQGVLPDPEEPGYWLVNARLGARTSDDRYGVAVFADNLFDKFYTVYGISLSLGNYINPGKRRIIGVEFSAKF